MPPHGPNPVDRAAVRSAVGAFYDDLPFNYHRGVESSAEAVRDNAVAVTYPDLDMLLRAGIEGDVLELGCGAGWLSNTMAYAYGARVTAVDLCSGALERARLVSDELGTSDRVEFLHRDIFEHPRERQHALVVSIGALHHTGDCRGAVKRAASLVAPGGSLYLGLYHAPGRRPFLDALQGLAEREGEDAALELYAELDTTRAADEILLRSWFRDQVLHPHETQHTLREVTGWFAEDGLELASTSINRFGPLGSLDELFELEATYAERSRRALEEERRYFPGFFTALGRRPA